ncbi:glycosyltransferase [Sphingobium sp. SJ10-10]|uniref:glycosyltransferase n=1 Tax=Sphingobium sp. SJ10-10 TaxID=3114999 RepID=UPI003866C635
MFQILATGRPLITRDSSAARELVQPGAAIRLVCPGDPADLATQLSALARDLREPVAAQTSLLGRGIMKIGCLLQRAFLSTDWDDGLVMSARRL